MKPKIQENLRKNVCERDVFFDLEISWIRASFWVGFGRVLGRFWVTFLDFFPIFYDMAMISIKKLDFGGILEGSGTGLGKVLGGSLEGFGRLLRGLRAF